MRKGLILLFLSTFLLLNGQVNLMNDLKKAESLIESNKLVEANKILNELEKVCNPKDTLYAYILWDNVYTVTELEKQQRLNEKFEKSLAYALEALRLIRIGKVFFDEKFGAREYWMIKNIIVSYYGLEQFDKAQSYKELLYKAYKEKKLPEGIEEYFNFSFFRIDNKNVWGYEMFEELPKDRFSKSFSKVIFYVYSTEKDGTDKVHLYNLEVLMFHKIDPNTSFDYVLTKRLVDSKDDFSGTLYAYTYKEKIDFKQLQTDIKEVVRGNYKTYPKTKETKTINKKH